MYQMVVICGNNKSAQSSLSPPQTNWGSNVAVNIKGFVNNMDEFMRASDILVTKAGPGTIAEASICGLPCILSSFLPGQEEGNVPYVEENGFGCYKGSPEGIADTVEEWLAAASFTTEGTILETMRENALNAARPDATLDIARDLADMVYKRREEMNKSVGKKEEVAVAA
jgi:1,2-diacylglycerol 3-beta-galactosyltransferase